MPSICGCTLDNVESWGYILYCGDLKSLFKHKIAKRAMSFHHSSQSEYDLLLLQNAFCQNSRHVSGKHTLASECLCQEVRTRDGSHADGMHFILEWKRFSVLCYISMARMCYDITTGRAAMETSRLWLCLRRGRCECVCVGCKQWEIRESIWWQSLKANTLTFLWCDLHLFCFSASIPVQMVNGTIFIIAIETLYCFNV